MALEPSDKNPTAADTTGDASPGSPLPVAKPVTGAARALPVAKVVAKPATIESSAVMAPAEAVKSGAEPTAATAADDAPAQESIWASPLWQQLRRDAPAWLTSMGFHTVVLLSLGLWWLPAQKSDQQNIMSAVAMENEAGQIEESPETPFDQIDLVGEAEPTSEPIETAGGGLADGSGSGEGELETLEVGSLEDTTAATGASVTVDVGDVGLATMPQSDMMSEIGGYGSSFGGRGESARKVLVAQRGGSVQSESCVERALTWLVQHQNPDGSWSFDHQQGQCKGRCGQPGNFRKANNSATGLALLPFLGAGQTHQQGRYKRQVQRALTYLVQHRNVTPDGASFMDQGNLYGHGIASIALCESFGMTQDRSLFVPAQQALNFIVYAQDKTGGGWRYAPGMPGDTSVVGWQLMALKSGHMAYLHVPTAPIRGLEGFLDSVQADEGAAYGYQTPGSGSGTTAVGLLCRMYLGWKHDNPALERGVQRLAAEGPSKTNVYFNYYATQVLHHFEGPQWETWNKELRDYYVETQAKTGHETGSWYMQEHHSEQGGRLYVTCLACMTLEVYYRHLPIYGQKSTENEFE